MHPCPQGEKFNVWLEPEVRFIGQFGERCGGALHERYYRSPDADPLLADGEFHSGEQLGERE